MGIDLVAVVVHQIREHVLPVGEGPQSFSLALGDPLEELVLDLQVERHVVLGDGLCKAQQLLAVLRVDVAVGVDRHVLDVPSNGHVDRWD
jgi:hypothetical protein